MSEQPEDATATRTRVTYQRPRLGLPHLFYLLALAGSAFAAFGWKGTIVGGCVLAGWLYVYAHQRRASAIMEVLMVSPVCACMLMATLLPDLNTSRQQAWQSICGQNLAALSRALQDYRNKNGSFPPTTTFDDQGQPLHSWRVLILPFLYDDDMPQSIKLDEPWHSPHNVTAIDSLEEYSYTCPAHAELAPTEPASYFAVTGPGTMWPRVGSNKPPSEPIANASTTIMLVEDHSKQVSWCEPYDLSLPEAVDRLSSDDHLGPHVHGGQSKAVVPLGQVMVVFADGRVHPIRQGLDRQTLRILFDPHANPQAKQAAFERATYNPFPHRYWWFRWGIFVVLAWLPAWWIRTGAIVADSPTHPLE